MEPTSTTSSMMPLQFACGKCQGEQFRCDTAYILDQHDLTQHKIFRGCRKCCPVCYSGFVDPSSFGDHKASCEGKTGSDRLGMLLKRLYGNRVLPEQTHNPFGQNPTREDCLNTLRFLNENRKVGTNEFSDLCDTLVSLSEILPGDSEILFEILEYIAFQIDRNQLANCLTAATHMLGIMLRSFLFETLRPRVVEIIRILSRSSKARSILLRQECHVSLIAIFDHMNGVCLNEVLQIVDMLADESLTALIAVFLHSRNCRNLLLANSLAASHTVLRDCYAHADPKMTVSNLIIFAQWMSKSLTSELTVKTISDILIFSRAVESFFPDTFEAIMSSNLILKCITACGVFGMRFEMAYFVNLAERSPIIMQDQMGVAIVESSVTSLGYWNREKALQTGLSQDNLATLANGIHRMLDTDVATRARSLIQSREFAWRGHLTNQSPLEIASTALLQSPVLDIPLTKFAFSVAETLRVYWRWEKAGETIGKQDDSWAVNIYLNSINHIVNNGIPGSNSWPKANQPENVAKELTANLTTPAGLALADHLLGLGRVYLAAVPPHRPLERALICIRLCQEIRRIYLGHEDPVTVQADLNFHIWQFEIAEHFRMQSWPTEKHYKRITELVRSAQQGFDRCTSLWVRDIGPNSAWATVALSWKAKTLMSQGDFDSAGAVLVRAIRMRVAANYNRKGRAVTDLVSVLVKNHFDVPSNLDDLMLNGVGSSSLPQISSTTLASGFSTPSSYSSSSAVQHHGSSSSSLSLSSAVQHHGSSSSSFSSSSAVQHHGSSSSSTSGSDVEDPSAPQTHSIMLPIRFHLPIS